VTASGRRFEVFQEPIEVTSTLPRPDEAWRYVDAAGHVHQWEWPDGKRLYRPGLTARVPTVEWVKTGVGYFPDGDEYEIGEYRCLQCAEEITPRSRADANRVFMPGMAIYYIDGEAVSKDVFERELKAEGLA
jgi:hypothetical protein